MFAIARIAKFFGSLTILSLLPHAPYVFAEPVLQINLECLRESYPDYIDSINKDYIIWKDGTKMAVQDGKKNKSLQEKMDNPSLADQLNQWLYPLNGYTPPPPMYDPGRIRFEPFFTKMYGQTASEVKKKLVSFYWMPKVFGKRYRATVTTVNSIHKKVAQISNELELMVLKNPKLRKYLENPGFFNWRMIANSKRLSSHSFGITIDISPKNSNYWQWDLTKLGLPVTETSALPYKNKVPLEIVKVFEKYGFIWGGKWYHYDTMHFEYRPELICSALN